LLVCKTFNAFLQKQRNAIAKSMEALDQLLTHTPTKCTTLIYKGAMYRKITIR